VARSTALDDVHDTAAQRLAENGLRYTSSRRAIVTVLARSDDPLTIPSILRKNRSLAQSSVYRNLGELTDAGIVHRIISGSDEFGHYELAEDLTTHHHHLVCTHCGRVSDFTASDSLESTLDAALARIARRTGFSVDHHRLDLIGTCADCR
jgi:Fur family transcriptional regulator, ferric uptake regulator